jgi:tetratricopeptide (TPR) repeat protein
MPPKFPEATRNTLNFKEMRKAGIGLASKLVIKQKYDMAKDVFMKLLDICPDDVEVMSLYANVFIVEGKLLEAEKVLNNVLVLNPDYPMALYFLGVVYHDNQEYEKSIHMYETALKHFPAKDKKDIADVYQNLGCSLWEVKRREEALEAWKTCLKYNPKQKYARENLKEFTNEYGMGKSPVDMDDFWTFVDLKQKEYLSAKGKGSFDDTDEGNVVLKKITDAWNTQVAEKNGKNLDKMKTNEKIKLFNEVKVF